MSFVIFSCFQPFLASFQVGFRSNKAEIIENEPINKTCLKSNCIKSFAWIMSN